MYFQSHELRWKPCASKKHSLNTWFGLKHYKKFKFNLHGLPSLYQIVM